MLLQKVEQYFEAQREGENPRFPDMGNDGTCMVTVKLPDHLRRALFLGDNISQQSIRDLAEKTSVSIEQTEPENVVIVVEKTSKPIDCTPHTLREIINKDPQRLADISTRETKELLRDHEVQKIFTLTLQRIQKLLIQQLEENLQTSTRDIDIIGTRENTNPGNPYQDIDGNDLVVKSQHRFENNDTKRESVVVGEVEEVVTLPFHPNLAQEIVFITSAGTRITLAPKLTDPRTLHDLIETGAPIEYNLRRLYGSLRGLNAVHSSNQTHHDFKPDNVLDLNEGALFDDETTEKTRKIEHLHEIHTTLEYSLNAIYCALDYEGELSHLPTTAIDVFAAGMSILETYIGGEKFDDLQDSIQSFELTPLGIVPKHSSRLPANFVQKHIIQAIENCKNIPPKIANLLERLLSSDQNHGMTIGDIMQTLDAEYHFEQPRVKIPLTADF